MQRTNLVLALLICLSFFACKKKENETPQGAIDLTFLYPDGSPFASQAVEEGELCAVAFNTQFTSAEGILSVPYTAAAAHNGQDFRQVVFYYDTLLYAKTVVNSGQGRMADRTITLLQAEPYGVRFQDTIPGHFLVGAEYHLFPGCGAQSERLLHLVPLGDSIASPFDTVIPFNGFATGGALLWRVVDANSQTVHSGGSMILPTTGTGEVFEFGPF